MDQLEEARDVALLYSTKYQQGLRRYHARCIQGRAFNVMTWCFGSGQTTRVGTN
jgi:hypothetical protein